MRRALTMVLLLGLVPRQACAQTRLELSGGYAMARDSRDEVTLPIGWMAGAAIAVSRTLSIVGDVSGQYKTVALLNGDAHLRVHTVMAGVRAAVGVGRLTEFGQIVAGPVRASGSAFGATTTGVSVAIQPGVGIDYPLTPRWAARAQFDVRLMRSQPDAVNGGYQYRFATGIVYRVHRR